MILDALIWLLQKVLSKTFVELVLGCIATDFALRWLSGMRADVAAIRQHLESINGQLTRRP